MPLSLGPFQGVPRERRGQPENRLRRKSIRFRTGLRAAKDFRTWAGTVECAIALRDIGEFSSETQAKKNVVAAIKTAAERLGNRAATCRTYYIHPAITEAYVAGDLLPVMRHPPESEGNLSGDERAILSLITQYRRTLEQHAVSAICA